MDISLPGNLHLEELSPPPSPAQPSAPPEWGDRFNPVRNGPTFLGTNYLELVLDVFFSSEWVESYYCSP